MLRAAAFFQFTCLGAPIIYYGDELGMEGGEDPDCRRPMAWDRVQNNKIHRHFARLAWLRAEHEALRQGAFRTVETRENGLYAYLRLSDRERMLCVLNTALEPVRGWLTLPADMAGQAVLHDWYGGNDLAVLDGAVRISLDEGEGMILGV